MIYFRAIAPVSATCIFGVAGLIVGCAHQDEIVACGGRDALLKSVLDYQFANNRSAIRENAAAYFIGFENGKDPSDEFLRRFDGRLPPVEPLSLATIIDHRVVDSRTSKPALIFQITKVMEPEQDRALVETGYYEAELSASWNTMQGICERGEWRITLVGPEMLS